MPHLGRNEAPLTALDAGNEVFHDAYRAGRDGARRRGTLLVVLPTELVLHAHGSRQVFPYSCAVFCKAKSTAHIAVALFTLTRTESDDEESRRKLSRLTEHIMGALDQLRGGDRLPIDDEMAALLESSLRFAQSARDGAAAEAAQSKFARDAGPRILKITELATCEQITGLHAAVDTALSSLSKAETSELEVVVVGDHQARTRSLGMQYFQRRFHEKPGADERITYGENIGSEDEAIALAGTRRLDRSIARAFFGDERRLQRDVLGDAAKRCLDHMQF